MKTETLHALVIDQHAGELQPEVADLLEAYFVAHPAARLEAECIMSTVNVMSQTMNRHPELVSHVVRVEPPLPPKVTHRTLRVWMKVAAVLAFAALMAGGGYFAGSTNRESRQVSPSLANATPLTSRKNSPWAQYRMALGSAAGGMRVVRVDLEDKEGRP